MRIHTPLFCWFAFSSLTEVELTRMVSFWGVQCDASIPTHILEWSAQSSYSTCLSPHVVTIILFSLVGVAGKIYSLMNFRHTERCCLLQSACCASDPKTPSLRVCTKIALPQPSPSPGSLLYHSLRCPVGALPSVYFLCLPSAFPQSPHLISQPGFPVGLTCCSPGFYDNLRFWMSYSFTDLLLIPSVWRDRGLEYNQGTE